MMNDLIKELEGATEGSRELDGRILQAICPKAERRHASWYIDDLRTDLDLFTTSLDAALTLVPEGWKREIMEFPEVIYEARLWDKNANMNLLPTCQASASTLALAVCSAALKARNNE